MIHKTVHYGAKETVSISIMVMVPDRTLQRSRLAFEKKKKNNKLIVERFLLLQLLSVALQWTPGQFFFFIQHGFYYTLNGQRTGERKENLKIS